MAGTDQLNRFRRFRNTSLDHLDAHLTVLQAVATGAEV